MTKLYIILSIVGWAWLIVAAVAVPILLRRSRVVEPTVSSDIPHEPH